MAAKINDDYFAQLGNSPQVVALVKGAADRIAATARKTAPRKTGAYARGITVRLKRSRYRTVAVVESRDSKTMLIESKTGNLARALRANGGSTRRSR